MFDGLGFMLSTPTRLRAVSGSRVSAGFFSTLGVAPILGRDFYAARINLARATTVMLSYSAWQKRFGGRRDVIGQTITLSGAPARSSVYCRRNSTLHPPGDAEFWTSFHASQDATSEEVATGFMG